MGYISCHLLCNVSDSHHNQRVMMMTGYALTLMRKQTSFLENVTIYFLTLR